MATATQDITLPRKVPKVVSRWTFGSNCWKTGTVRALLTNSAVALPGHAAWAMAQSLGRFGCSQVLQLALDAAKLVSLTADANPC